MLGCNLFSNVMEGFFKRVWGKWGIERVIFIKKDIFIVRFYIFNNRKKVMKDRV